MSPTASSPGQPGWVALSAASATGSLTTATLSTASVTGIFGTQDTITFIAVPAPEYHDQQRRKPLDSIEAGTMDPFLFGLGGYMAARKVFRVVRSLRDLE